MDSLMNGYVNEREAVDVNAAVDVVDGEEKERIDGDGFEDCYCCWCYNYHLVVMYGHNTANL